jgi:hypothetical protein
MKKELYKNKTYLSNLIEENKVKTREYELLTKPIVNNQLSSSIQKEKETLKKPKGFHKVILVFVVSFIIGYYLTN